MGDSRELLSNHRTKRRYPEKRKRQICCAGLCAICDRRPRPWHPRKWRIPPAPQHRATHEAQIVEALWLSILLAVLVAAILLVLAVPLAYWLSQTTWRAKFLIESVIALPLVL